MSVEMSIPFRTAANGTIAVDTDPGKQIAQRVKALVGTEPGERVIIPNYGVPVSSMLFQPNDLSSSAELVDMISVAADYWEPGVIVTSATPIPTADDQGVASVDVGFIRTDAADSPPALARNTNSVTVYPGGRIVEAVRG